MDLPWPMVRDGDDGSPQTAVIGRDRESVLDRVSGHLLRVRELGDEVLQIADRMDERNERRCSCGGDHTWPHEDGAEADDA
jgi:hypothetical protein